MPSVFLIKLSGVALVLAVSFYSGCRAEANRSDAVIAGMHAAAAKASLQAAEAAALTEQLQRDKASALAQAQLLRNQQLETVERIVTNEVIRYVQTPAGNERGLDAAGVRIHNTATNLSTDSGSATASDEGAREVTAANLIRVVTQNYSICHDTSSQLLALQEWVRLTLDSYGRFEGAQE